MALFGDLVLQNSYFGKTRKVAQEGVLLARIFFEFI